MITWAAATLGAAALGAVGPVVIGKLPPSPDADPESPTYPAIAAAPQLGLWLAALAAAAVTIAALAVPVRLLPAWVVLCGIGSWLAYVDWRLNLLPTRIVWPMTALLAVVVGAEAWFASAPDIAIRAGVMGALAFGAYWFFWRVGEFWRAGALGYGDVRFSAPLGLVLGSVGGWGAMAGLYLGLILGAVAGIVLKARGINGHYALGPWMFAGAVLGPIAATLIG